MPDDQYHLYWVWTDDHDEDWFIVATSEEEAAELFEDAEDYDEGEAEAEFVCVIPEKCQALVDGFWPALELLEACGGKVMRRDSPRVVKFGERVYTEGLLDSVIDTVQDNMAEDNGMGRPHGTKRDDSVH